MVRVLSDQLVNATDVSKRYQEQVEYDEEKELSTAYWRVEKCADDKVVLLRALGDFCNEQVERIDEKEEERCEEHRYCGDPASLLIIALFRQAFNEVAVLHAVDLASGLHQRLSHHGCEERQETDKVDDNKDTVKYLEASLFLRL